MQFLGRATGPLGSFSQVDLADALGSFSQAGSGGALGSFPRGGTFAASKSRIARARRASAMRS
jgi:hypothetical protein